MLTWLSGVSTSPQALDTNSLYDSCNESILINTTCLDVLGFANVVTHGGCLPYLALVLHSPCPSTTPKHSTLKSFAHFLYMVSQA